MPLDHDNINDKFYELKEKLSDKIRSDFLQVTQTLTIIEDKVKKHDRLYEKMKDTIVETKEIVKDGDRSIDGVARDLKHFQEIHDLKLKGLDDAIRSVLEGVKEINADNKDRDNSIKKLTTTVGSMKDASKRNLFLTPVFVMLLIWIIPLIMKSI